MFRTVSGAVSGAWNQHTGDSILSLPTVLETLAGLAWPGNHRSWKTLLYCPACCWRQGQRHTHYGSQTCNATPAWPIGIISPLWQSIHTDRALLLILDSGKDPSCAKATVWLFCVVVQWKEMVIMRAYVLEPEEDEKKPTLEPVHYHAEIQEAGSGLQLQYSRLTLHKLRG